MPMAQARELPPLWLGLRHQTTERPHKVKTVMLVLVATWPALWDTSTLTQTRGTRSTSAKSTGKPCYQKFQRSRPTLPTTRGDWRPDTSESVCPNQQAVEKALLSSLGPCLLRPRSSYEPSCRPCRLFLRCVRGTSTRWTILSLFCTLRHLTSNYKDIGKTRPRHQSCG